MRYEIMGSVRIQDRDGYSSIGAKKIETVLVALLIRAEHVVSIDQLSTEIWGTNRPRRANAALHVYLSQLRKILNRPGHGGSTIETRSPGYVLHLGSDELDLHRFQRLVDEGRNLIAAQRHEEAALTLQTASDLWREPVLGDLRNGPIVHGFVTWLEDLRLACVEMLAATNLVLGRHQQLIGFLRPLIAEHPLHEEFHRQLMLALYRSDRRGDALKVYHSAREIIRRELGLEPCRALRELQQAILAADERIDVSPVAL